MSEIDAYRLVKTKWASSAFDGEGAKRYGGRWNSRGKACVYLSASESLAVLEILVHLNDTQQMNHYTLLQLSIKQTDILYLPEENMPDNWKEFPAPADTAELGDAWLRGTPSLALAVPSVIVPREWNYILNPAHDKFNQTILNANRLNFEPDQRLIN